MSFRTRWRVREYVRNSIWIVPALFATAAIVAGLVFPDLDQQTTATEDVVQLTPETARGLLGALAGGMITFTGFVFSILLLAVQFGSSQFSPRMLRRFLRDRTTKVALGMFIATFIYALLVLGSIGTTNEADFVPVEAVQFAVVLLLLSMFMFLRLISKTTQGLRVATVLKDLGADARKIIDEIYPDPVTDPAAAGANVIDSTHDSAPSSVVPYREAPSVLQSIDVPGLVAQAVEHDVVIELVPPIGTFLIDGEALFHVYGGSVDENHLAHSVATGDERTLGQDPGFAFRLLADISSKALSPGVNDPATATQALDQIELLLRQIAQRRLTPGVAQDAEGRVRLHYPAPSWEDYVSLALAETRQYGEGSVQVSRRLHALLHGLREVAPPYRRAAIDAELALLGSSVQRGFSDEIDRDAAGAEDRQGIGSPQRGAEAALSG